MTGSFDDTALSLANDTLNFLPQYRSDYLNLNALAAAVQALVEPHLVGGTHSLKTVVGLKVRAGLRLQHGLSELHEQHAREQDGHGLEGGAAAVDVESAGEAPSGETRRLLSTSASSAEPLVGSYRSLVQAAVAEDDPADIRVFVERFTGEVDRVDRVYARELEKLHERFGKLLAFCHKVVDAKGLEGLVQKAPELGPEFEVLYRKAHHLESFALTNMSIASTLLHHRKVASRRWGLGWLGKRLLSQVLELRGFSSAQDVRFLESRICKSFAEYFSDGNESVAAYQLLRKQRDEIDWLTVKVGIWVGAALMGLLWALYALIVNPEAFSEPGPPSSGAGAGAGAGAGVGAAGGGSAAAALTGGLLDADGGEVLRKDGGFRVFRVGGLLLLMGIGFCVQMVFWREARINVPVILGIPAPVFPATGTLFLIAARSTVAYLLCLVVYVSAQGPLADLCPWTVVLAIGFVWYRMWYRIVLLPRLVRARRGDSRWRALLASAKGALVFALGLSDQFFLTAYVTDYLTSSTKILADMAIVLCNLLVRPGEEEPPVRFSARLRVDSPGCLDSPTLNTLVIPVIMCWPLWLRVGQNLSRMYQTGRRFPFILNACKYGLAHTVVIFSVLHRNAFQVGDTVDIAAFTFVFVLTSLVTFSWDVLVDWGLGNPAQSGLRSRLMLFPSYPAIYYTSIALDFVLRFVWTLQLVPRNSTTAHELLFGTAATTGLEVVRRSWWGLLRVENEMLSNTRQYTYTVDKENAHFIPLYFERPFSQEMESAALKQQGITPAERSARDMCEIVSQIAAFMVLLSCAAAAAIFYKSA